MDLTSMLLRVAARRPHVLVVPTPGGTAVRWAVEASLARRGWPQATGPADADIVLVAGTPGPDLAAIVERIWRQVPAPRARVVVSDPADVDGPLERAAAELRDRDRQRADEHGPAAGDHESHDEPAGHETQEASGEHGGHHGHHGHGGEMELPGGLPMADLGEDRDGLTLDRLHVPLGPVLPDWPAGLVVRVTLQGDVIQEAAAELLDAGHGGPSRRRNEDAVARELDGLARFLGVAGWDDAAARSRRLRNALLTGEPTEQAIAPVTAQVAALVRRVRRSRTLRWSIRGIGTGAADVAALLERRLTAIETALAGGDGSAPPRPGVDEVANLLVGAELAAARLIVAAVDPDTDPDIDAAAARTGVRHG